MRGELKEYRYVTWYCFVPRVNHIIRVLLFALVLACELDDALGAEGGFTPIFNGKDLSGWVGAMKAFYVENGVLVCRSGGAGNLYTAKEYSDFVFRFEFRLTPGANNGLGIRAPLDGDAAFLGLELQILDNSADRYAELRPYQYHGSVYGVAAAKRGSLNPVGQWNTQEVHCVGRRITVIVNGTKVTDVDLDHVAPNGQTLDGEDHPGLQRESGHVGFLAHGDRVEFRNIRIREVSGRSGIRMRLRWPCH